MSVLSPCRGTAIAAALLFAPSLSGQQGGEEPAQGGEQPAPPVIHLQVGGPGVWRTHLTPTNLGSLLASGASKKLWLPLVQPLERMAAQWLGSEAAFAEARARFLDYSGAFDLRVWRQPNSATTALELRLLPDRRTDMAALGRDLSSMMERASGRTWEDRKPGRPRTLVDGGKHVTEPTLHGDVVVVVAAEERELDAALRRATAAATRNAGQAARAPAIQPLSLHFDVAQGIRASGETELFRALGFGSLASSAVEIGAAGPHLRVDLRQSFAGGDRGLLAALFPDVQGLPPIAGLQPADATGWKAGYFDWKALYRAALATDKMFGGDNKEAIDQWFGGDSDTGALAYLGSEYMMFGSMDEREESLLSTSLGVAFRVTDEAKFAAKWKRARKSLGMTMIEEQDHDGVAIQRRGGFFSSWAAVGRGLFILGYGPECKARIAELLDAAAARPQWTAKPAEAAHLRPILRHAPPGLNGIAEGHVSIMYLQVGTALALLSELVRELGLPELNQDDEDKKVGVALLKEHNLVRAYSLTGFDDKRWHFRLLW